MNKFVSLFICLSLAFTLAVSATALTGENYALFSSSSKVDIPINEHIGGDANGDGKVNLIDAVAVLRSISGETYNISRDSVDANGDGTISVVDAILIIKHVVGNSVGLGSLVG